MLFKISVQNLTTNIKSIIYIYIYINDILMYYIKFSDVY